MSILNNIFKSPSKASHLVNGEKAEQQALKFLISKGLKLVCQNYHCKYGELDLIMEDDVFLVIVEVKFRSSKAFGGAIASVTRKKQHKIIATTQYYLATHSTKKAVRFDVVAIESTEINWVKNAFQT